MLLGYSWPGNVRELKQVIHAAVLICKGKLITPNSLRLQYTGESVSDPMGKEKIDKCLQKDERRNIEQIKTALSISKGNLTQAAAIVGNQPPDPLQENEPARNFQIGLFAIQFSPSSKENRICLAGRFAESFRGNFPCGFAVKIFTKKNAAAIQIRFEKRLQGQTATDVTHG